MNRLVVTALLSVAGLGQAQSANLPTFSPVYQKYLAAADSSLTSWSKINDFLKDMTRDLESKSDPAISVGSAYACSTFLKSLIANTPAKDINSRTTRVGDFSGGFAQAQQYCDKILADSYRNLPDVNKAAENVSDLGLNYLVIESDKNGTVQSRADKIKRDLKDGDINTSYLIYTLALDTYLQKYPELKDRRFQVSSVAIGKGSTVLENSLKVLSDSTSAVTDYAKANNQQVTAANNQAMQEATNGIKKLYMDVVAQQAKGDKLMKDKKFQDAWQVYTLLDGYKPDLETAKSDIARLKITSPININGKNVPVNEVIAMTSKIIAGGRDKGTAALKAREAALQALAAQWKQAAKNTLKGDRLTVFNRFGIPNVLLPGDMYTGDQDIKTSMANIQKATGWRYSFSQTALGGFFCNVSVDFSGNKVISKGISASIVSPDAAAYCRSNYNF